MKTPKSFVQLYKVITVLFNSVPRNSHLMKVFTTSRDPSARLKYKNCTCTVELRDVTLKKVERYNCVRPNNLGAVVLRILPTNVSVLIGEMAQCGEYINVQFPGFN